MMKSIFTKAFHSAGRVWGTGRPGLRVMAAGAALMLLLTACFAGGGQKPAAPDDLREAAGEEITDPAIIQGLWDDLMYYAILGLQDDFDDPRELDTWTLISFAADRYLGSHDLYALQMTMATVDENFGERSYYVLPYAQVDAQIKEIFNLEMSLEGVDFEVGNGYGPYMDMAGAGGLLLEEGADNRYEGPRPMAENPWGAYIERVLRLEDDSLVVALSDNVHGTDLVDSRNLYLLRPRGEGEGYYVQRCQTTYVNNHLAGLTGKYRELAFAWDGYATGGETLIWEDDDSLYLFDGNAPGEEEGQYFVYLHRISKADGTEITAARLSATVDEQQNVNPSIRHISGGFLLKDAANVYYLDENFQVVKTTPVPQALKDRMGYVYDPETNRTSVFFGGYEVTGDLSTWYYSCQDGLFRYDAATGAETLLVAPEYGHGKLMEGAILVPSGMRLMEGESRLIYIIYGYEGISQANSLDLSTGTGYPMPIAGYGGFGGTQYGVGQTSIDLGNPAYSDNQVVMNTFLFAGNTTVSCPIPLPPLEDPTRDYIDFEPIQHTGRRYAAGAFYRYTAAREETDFALYRADLTQAQPVAEKLDFNLDTRYAQARVIGVTDEGKVLLWYIVNPAERGLLLAG